MKRILVTGGSGFLGSWLCEKLLEQGNEVICVDNFFTGAKRNIYHMLNHPRFEVIRHDVTFPLYIECDEIYNLACPASPIHYQKDPVQTVKTCVHGAINMLGLAKRVNAKILCNGKNGDQKTIIRQLDAIHAALTRRKDFPSGEGWQIYAIETVASPRFLGRESNNRFQWLYGSSLLVKINTKGI